MSRITMQRLIRLCILFLALTKMTLATPTNNISQRKHKPQHLAPQLEYGEAATRAANSDLSFRQPAAVSTRSTLSKRMDLWDKLRLGTLYIVWSATRINSLTNPSPSPPGPFDVSLQKLYTSIRRDALSIWASLPERSYVRIVYGSPRVHAAAPGGSHRAVEYLGGGGLCAAAVGEWRAGGTSYGDVCPDGDECRVLLLSAGYYAGAGGAGRGGGAVSWAEFQWVEGLLRWFIHLLVIREEGSVDGDTCMVSEM